MNKTLDEILKRAKKQKLKGRLYIYESYKREIEMLDLSPEEYQDACRLLAQHLEV